MSALLPRRVAVVGAGRVGTAMAHALARAGLRVVAATDGGSGRAAVLAAQLAGCRVEADTAAAVEAADLILLTVPDGVIGDAVASAARADAWQERHRVVHCSGVLGLDVLRLAHLAGAGVAACHPAQTIPAGAGAEALVGVPWAVTCAGADRDWAHELVITTGGDPFDLAAGARTLYHAALVLGSNAAAAAVASARQLLLAAGVADPARILGPLATASVANVARHGATALTGPVVRGDHETVAQHLEALDADLPHVADAYRALQGVVLSHVAPALDPEARARLAALLEDES